MFIERLQVEGGFLDGLDVDLSNGLNVLIGGRGTGKTSVIELLRYCFAVPAYTDEINLISSKHAKGVLGDGRVTATINHKGQSLLISRSNTEMSPKGQTNVPFPTIFSQKEIESIGLTSEGRRKLIDKFLEFLDVDVSPNFIQIRSITRNITKVSQEIDELGISTQAISEIEKQLAELDKQLRALNPNQEDMNVKKKESDELLAKSSSINIRIKTLESYLEDFITWSDDHIESFNNLPDFGEYSSDDDQFFKKYRKAYSDLYDQLDKTTDASLVLVENLQEEIKSLNEEKVKYDEKARTLRKSIEEMQKGAGKIMREIADLKQKQKEKETIPEIIKKKKQRLKQLIVEREEFLNALDSNRESTVALRRSIISELNKKLKPHIKISMQVDAVKDEYLVALLEILKGGGLRYKEIADQIVNKISPRELIDIVESFNTEKLQHILEINKERAFKVVSTIRENGWENILTCRLEDEISFEFLDGEDYKDFNELSTGQRCTVMLPIILEQDADILILDQPEDHLDNGYITETLVKAIKDKAGKGGQLIIATHNANIPVLGEASRVVHFKSDGMRGYADHCGDLDDRASVEAITKVMEGGIEAFKLREKFYMRHFN